MSDVGRLRARRALAAVTVGVLALLALGERVSAHTDFGGSEPVDGAVVPTAVGEVVVTFTGPATPVGAGFEALDVDDTVRAPVEVVAGQVEGTDDARFVLRFDPPLAGGSVGIRWTVSAADGHVLEGAFSFTAGPAAASPVPTTGAAASPTSPATTTPTVTTAPAVAPPTTMDHSAMPGMDHTSTPGMDHSAMPGMDHSAMPDMDAAEHAAMMEAFLDGDDEGDDATAVGRAGRMLGLVGAITALGALVVLTFVFRGTAAETDRVVSAVRLLGVAVTAGAVVELAALTSAGMRVGEVASSSVGVALGLRMLGGAALFAGLSAHPLVAPAPARSLSAAVAVADPGEPARVDVGWRGDLPSVVTLAGAFAVLVSFAFDGHTVTEGARWLHAALDVVHVGAGAVWAGGVITLAAIVWGRYRGGRPLDAAGLVVRFSTIATGALAAVFLAGVLMALQVLDGFGELTGTEWGRVLLVKLAAVAVAVALGSYNHVVLRPALSARPDEPALLARTRHVLAAEAAVLLVVILVTAWLVGAMA